MIPTLDLTFFLNPDLLVRKDFRTDKSLLVFSRLSPKRLSSETQ